MPLRDIGFTFAVELGTSSKYADTDEGAEGLRDEVMDEYEQDEEEEEEELQEVSEVMDLRDDRSLSPSSDEGSVINVPRVRDPYFYAVDVSSRDSIAYCLCSPSPISVLQF